MTSTTTNTASTQAATPGTQDAPPCTPEQHASASKTKPVRVLELSHGTHGKTALLQFPDGWSRTIALPTQADAWHPMFSDLPTNDTSALRAHVAPAVVLHPDGTRTRPGPVSFVTQEVNRVGGWMGERSFDVPAEDCATGNVTGLRCAAELLDALERGYGPHINLSAIIKTAAQASQEPLTVASRSAAGGAFLSVVAAALPIMARQSHHAQWLNAKIAEAEDWQAHQAKVRAESRAAFVERMKAAKVAKRSKTQHADA